MLYVYPKIYITLKPTAQPTVSGRMDADYPSLSDPKLGLAALREIGGIKKIPLPEELTEQYARILTRS